MPKLRFFLSLRWKLATLFGCVFLVMHTIFSYFACWHTQEEFAANRLHEQRDHIRLAHTLTGDGYLMLEQLAEMLPLLPEPEIRSPSAGSPPDSALDEKWSEWQLSWGIEHITLFDTYGSVIKSWGTALPNLNTNAKTALHTEMPEHKVVCFEHCYQEVIVPVISANKAFGAYGISRSFGDIMIKYRQATGSDIGILFADDKLREAPGHPWPYRLAGLTLSDFNKKLYDYIAAHLSIEDLRQQHQTIRFNRSVFEVGVTSIPGSEVQDPLFLLINDITRLDSRLQEDLRKVWLYGVISLLLSLLLLPILLYYTLARVSTLSSALPLLAKQQYDQFRSEIPYKSADSADFDELDQLNQTALTLAEHLETLEQEVYGNTLKLIEKSRELAGERDFIQQIFDTAPVIMLTQKPNGVILSVNHTGSKEFAQDEKTLKGKIFDLLLPESEHAHRRQLGKLRTGEINGPIQCEGQLASESGGFRKISWRHTRFNPASRREDAVILSIGVDHTETALSQVQRTGDIAGPEPMRRQTFTHLQYLPVLHSSTLLPHHYDCRFDCGLNGTAVLPRLTSADETVQIERLAFTNAIRTLHHAELLKQTPRLSINLSEQVFGDEDFLHTVIDCFKKYDIDPCNIIFTIPEQAVDTHYRQAQHFIAQLKSLGSSVALDDFGNSLSAFRFLEQLPIDFIKIDAQLIRGNEPNEDDKTFVKSLSDAAHRFGKLIIVKYVDHDGLRKTLTDLGVDFIQGKIIDKLSVPL